MNSFFHVEPGVAQALADAGLNSFDSLHGAVKVRRVFLPDGSVLYVKSCGRDPLPVALRMLLRGRLPCSAASRERLLLQRLKNAGFLTMEPVAWGERRCFGWPVAGVLAVREVRGDLLAHLFDSAQGQQKRVLMQAMGRLTGRLHAAGFFHPVRLKDLIRTEEGLVLIDRETSKPWRSLFFREQCRVSLVRAFRRMARDGHRIGVGCSCAFLQGYRRGVASRWRVEPLILTAQICARIRRARS